MAWSANDAKKFKKDLTPQQTNHWAKVANRVLSRTGSEGEAVKAANAATKSAMERRLRKKNQSSISGKGY